MPLSEALLIDNMEYMRSLPDNKFSLAICDPPYGININNSMGRRKGAKKSNFKEAYWDKEPPAVEYFNEIFRVSKNQIIWGANHFISRMPYDSSCWLMWDKRFSDEISFAQFELAWTSFKSTCKKFDKDPGQKNRIHATQKPVELYAWILKNYAKEGDSIFDPNFGSGSSRIACNDMGFDYTGCEIDEDIFKDAEKRFRIHKKQTKLFTPEPLETIQTELFSS